LCLIDIYPPAVYVFPEIESEDDDAQLVALLGQDLDLYSAEFQQLVPTDRLIYVVEQAKQKKLIPASVDIAEVRRILMVQKLNTQALKNYTPQYYSGSIVLFTASDRHPAIKQDIDFESSWNQLAKQVETFLMPGNHYSMIEPPLVQILAQKFQLCLDRSHKHQLETSNAQTTEK
jgi:thioesterase domain-containing protein